MKKTIIILFLFISTAINAQKKDSVLLTDSTALFTLKDLTAIDGAIQKQFTISDGAKYQSILQFMQQLVADRIKEWQEKQKKK